MDAFRTEYNRGFPIVQILTDASCQNAPSCVREILEEAHDVPQETRDLCLCLAAMHGHEQVVAVLLEHGADISVRRPPKHWTPYQMALDSGQRRVCEILLAAGAVHEDAGGDLWEGGGFYPDPARLFVDARALAQYSPDAKAARFLKLASRGETALCAAMQKHEPLLANAVSVVESWGAIHVAAQNGHLDVVRLLLDSGVDVNTVTHQEETALQFARWGGYRELVALLEERGGVEGPL
jgi:ankyrin repeat protein